MTTLKSQYNTNYIYFYRICIYNKQVFGTGVLDMDFPKFALYHIWTVWKRPYETIIDSTSVTALISTLKAVWSLSQILKFMNYIAYFKTFPMFTKSSSYLNNFEKCAYHIYMHVTRG